MDLLQLAMSVSDAEIDRAIKTLENKWKPFADTEHGPHPQRLALESKADILGYGGAAGGGKSDLLLGVAGWHHYRSVIFRRVFPSLRGIIDRSREVYNPLGDDASVDSYNESLYRWRFQERGRAQLRFGSLQYEKDVLAWQGQPHDFYGFDELTEFTEYQFRFVTGWNRTSRPGQRCRVIATMNPPTTKEGEWVIRYFAPWLDDTHPNPAAAGELRWFTTVDGKDIECDDATPFILAEDGKTKIYDIPASVSEDNILRPRSRTFIFARVVDNPILVASGYVATLQALPEPMRSKMLYGDFRSGMEEDPWQIFPTDWVLAAQKRWKEMEEPKHIPVVQLGVDVARGGTDRTVLTPRRDYYFCEQKLYPGKETKKGSDVIARCAPLCTEDTKICIDVIGVGSSPFDLGEVQGMNVVAMNGAEKTEERSKAGNLGFYNRRAAWHWRLREALDPASGENLAIPDDPELRADLTAMKWEITTRGIKVRDKDETKDILGRSPDKGESLIYAYGAVVGAAEGLLGYMKKAVAEKQAAEEATRTGRKSPPKQQLQDRSVMPA